jgi:DNA gyrase subunit A
VDVRDESTEEVRIVLELKQGASAEAVMAWLFKHTPLEGTFPVNLTCLVPTDGGVPAPMRLDLKEILRHWSKFRFDTTRRRFEFQLKKLRERIHILEGFAIVFDALDEAVALIRRSEGKADAAERLIERFGLTDVQADAILELRLYKLAKLEIQGIRDELAECRREADRIGRLLSSDKRLWSEVRKELLELRRVHGAPRRTTVGVPKVDVSYDEDAYIVKEDTWVVVTREGWVKRQSTVSDLAKVRVREGDEVGWLVKAHTRSSLTFFTSHGSAYVLRTGDVEATTGYGTPLQAHFAFADGERVVGLVSHDARHRPLVQESLPLASDEPPPPWAVAMTVGGRVLRFPTRPHEEVSTRAGRRYARLDDGDAVLAVWPQRTEGDRVCVASKGGRASVFPASEVGVLRAAGKGVTGIKLKADDSVVAFELASGPMEGPIVVTSFGRELEVRERKFGLASRGARGKVVLVRGSIDVWKRAPVVWSGEESPRPAPVAADVRGVPPALDDARGAEAPAGDEE